MSVRDDVLLELERHRGEFLSGQELAQELYVSRNAVWKAVASLREQGYGIGFTQYRNNWSVSLYYALRNGCDYLDGIIGFGVKTLF